MRFSRALLGCCFLVLVLLSPGAEADSSATWIASADTCISSHDTANSDGKGTQIFAGYTGTTFGARRALVRFNIASTANCTDNTANGINDCSLPVNSDITYASLRLYVTRTPSAPQNSTFYIYRLTRAWGEGNSTAPASNGGLLVSAASGDATWLYAKYTSSAWSSAGGNFSTTVSASSAFSTTTGYKYFTTTSPSTMTSDVQGWVNTPTSNNGWILKTVENGTTGQTARQIASRENATTAYRPHLTIHYKRPQGAACNSGSDCKGGLYCTDGVCCNVSACTAQNECHNAGSCQPGSGVCSNPIKTNGTACTTDNNVCTSDVCESGNCSHLTNQGGVLCRASGGECDQADYCVNGSSACPDGKVSSGTACTTDNNPCTVDECNGSSNFCQHTAGNAGTVCRASVGVCDVAETCDGVSTSCPSDSFKSSSTQCRAASCQSGTVAILPAYCPGNSASCPAQATQDCSPSTCQGSTCLGGCTVDTDCASGNYCAAPDCLPLKSNGTACGANHECGSGNCIDGVCCNTSCGGGDPNDCQACNTSSAPGTCVALPSSHVCRASAGTCDLAESCDGSSTSCPSNSFKSSSTQCRAASCANGVETLSATCPGNGAACPSVQTQTCTPFVCGATACKTSCTADTDCIVGDYCDGSACVQKIADGLSCSSSHQCTSGHCTDGVCCNSACSGQCQACDVNPGVCTAVSGAPRGSRPACAADGSACDGYCNGQLTSACFYPGSATECTAPSCTGGVATLQAFCNGSGSCPAVQTQNCSPFSCGPDQCFANCSLDVQCADGYFCSGGMCKPKSADGNACGAADQCTSGFCIDGVCCDAACSGQCEACDVTGSVGTCTPVTGAPHGSRAACITDGSLCGGSCDGKLTATCTYAGPGTVCRQASCTSDNATLEAFCTGTGHCPPEVRQDCAPFQCNASGTACAGNCTLDTDCAPSQFCAGGVCTPRKGVGQACSSSASCISGVCVDGYCCNEACTGQCEACDVTGSEGTCTAVSGAPHGTRAACSGDGSTCDGTCDGSDRTGCSYPGTSTQCRQASCAGGVATLASYCTGSGACPAMQQQVCPGSCGSSGLCAGGCTTSSQCGAGKYCSAGVCVVQLADGQPCGDDAQCTNGHCVDGFCCASACTDQCSACDVPGSEGFCTPVKGQPHGGRPTCGGSGPCGAQCNGQSPPKCEFPGSETYCGVGSCTNGVATGLAVCNSAGSCLPPTTQDCAPYACNGVACGTSCSSSTDCLNGYSCDTNGVCVAAVADAGSDAADAGSDASADASSDASVDSSVDASAGSGGMAGMAGGGGTAGMAGSAGNGGNAGSATAGSGGSAGSITGGSGNGGSAGGVDAGSAGAAGKKGASGQNKGGCGCRVPAAPENDTGAAWLLLLGLGLVAVRRRKQGSRRRS